MAANKEKTAQRTIVAFFAHPDDEVFGTGATLAHYAASGVRVVLVCATRGEVGEIADESLATPETLPQVREAELRCSADTLGINEVILLDYRDSGMVGTPENEDLRAFINAPANEVVAQLTAILEKERPQVVITFDPHGGYGHPDHIAIHTHTVTAVDSLSNPPRLFFSAIPRSFFGEMRQRLQAMGQDTSELDRFQELGEVGWLDEQVHATLDVGDGIEAKWAAFHCHRTQFSGDTFFFRLPEADVKQMLSREHYILARPQPEPGLKLDDLFANLS